MKNNQKLIIDICLFLCFLCQKKFIFRIDIFKIYHKKSFNDKNE